MTTESELRTPAEWEAELGITVVDPDGWDRTNFAEDWARPISREVFWQKVGSSTVNWERMKPDLGPLHWVDEAQLAARIEYKRDNPEAWDDITMVGPESADTTILDALKTKAWGRGRHVGRG